MPQPQRPSRRHLAQQSPRHAFHHLLDTRPRRCKPTASPTPRALAGLLAAAVEARAEVDAFGPFYCARIIISSK